ncbi:hypothetical protein D8674_012820 [Pyrus ussuriensis x Pyrus communis]|uniref:Uncharacterized protein n=1 Tax=Pyrus ussuriensis x Pyrus communis TaxID=2448454 RepID=A0A5N5GSS0_9ROSA|nr:hypothetical protein D8674_012820 [Pyrus ussuriensis x Pyrus communis]
MSWNSIGHYQRSLHILGNTPEAIISWLEKDRKTNPGQSHSINSSDIIWKCFVVLDFVNSAELSSAELDSNSKIILGTV